MYSRTCSQLNGWLGFSVTFALRRAPSVNQLPQMAHIGRRLARLRKTAALTQVELAEKIGIIQALVSAYEQDKLKLSAEMAVRFAKALNVSTDELLGFTTTRRAEGGLSLRLTRRLKGIEGLPAAQQKALLQTIDAFLKSTG
jgi:transcriptional regulator with XRE-family HTH domain